MFSKSIVAATATLSLIASTSALYDASSPSNVVVYWGQAPGQMELGYYCNQSTIDVINVAFITPFPQQTNGLPGENFGNQCYGTPTYPGSNGKLPENCPLVQQDLPYCQKVANKKIVLSLGGGTNTYQLTGKQAGIDFAHQLWQMYGPYNATYVAAGGIRPLDRSSSNTNPDPFYQIDIDGFDFDIEVQTTDQGLGYISMINTLRSLFATNPCKKYTITGAPQCSVPDAIMDPIIQQAQFDALYVQYYNTPACSARTWVQGNSALNTTGGKNSTAGFTYDNWVSRTASGASKNAKMYIGLLGSPAGSSSAPGDFLWPAEATNLIDTYVKDTRFGGVMLFDATYANQQQVSYGKYSGNYYGFIKSVLSNFAPKTTAPVTSLCPSTTSTSSSASKTSTTTTSSSKSSTSSTTSSFKPSTSSTTTKSSTISTTSTTSSSSKTSTSVSPNLSTTSKSSTSTTSKTSSSSTTSIPTTTSISTSSKSSSSTTSKTSSSSTTSIPTTSTISTSSKSSSSSSTTPISSPPNQQQISKTSGISTSITITLPTLSDNSVPTTTLPTTTSSLVCYQDNCVRAFDRFSASAEAFCSTYTTAIVTDTAIFPSFATNCPVSPSALSSGCSCVFPAATTAPSTTSSTTSASPTSTSTSSESSTSTSETSTSSSPSTSTSDSSSVSSVVSTSSSSSSPSSSQSSSSSSGGSTTTSKSSSVILSTGYTSPTGSSTSSLSSSILPPFTNSSSTATPTGTSPGSSSTPSSSTSTSKSSGISSPPSSSKDLTTLTSLETNTYTITSGKVTQVTTETIAVTTTICPVTASEGSGGEKPTKTPGSPAGPSVTTPSLPGGVSQPSASDPGTTVTTIRSTLTSYRTIQVVQSTVTVVPVAPYPTGSASSAVIVSGTGTGLPSVSWVSGSSKPSIIGAGPTPAPSLFVGAATKLGAGSMIAVVLAVIMALVV